MSDMGQLIFVGGPTLIVAFSIYLIVIGFTKGSELRHKKDKSSGDKAKEALYYFMSSIILAIYAILGFFFVQDFFSNKSRGSVSTSKYLMARW